MTVIKLSDFRPLGEDEQLVREATKLSSELGCVLLDKTQNTPLMIMASAMLLGRMAALVSPAGHGAEVLDHAMQAAVSTLKTIEEMQRGT